MMALTLLSLMAVPLPQGLGLFTVILLVHNTFGAIQDVAIDSLACNTLDENERGLANGLMFAGAAVGQALGRQRRAVPGGRDRASSPASCWWRGDPGRDRRSSCCR